MGVRRTGPAAPAGRIAGAHLAPNGPALADPPAAQTLAQPPVAASARPPRCRVRRCTRAGADLLTRPLLPSEVVLSVDEKTSLQPRPRRAPTRPACPEQGPGEQVG